MGLKKGTTNNPNGRPRGKPNRVTMELKSSIQSFLSGQWPMMQKDFKKLEPKDRLAFYERLLKYALPTMQSTKAEIKFDDLPEDQLDRIISKLMNDEDADPKATTRTRTR